MLVGLTELPGQPRSSALCRESVSRWLRRRRSFDLPCISTIQLSEELPGETPEQLEQVDAGGQPQDGREQASLEGQEWWASRSSRVTDTVIRGRVAHRGMTYAPCLVLISRPTPGAQT